MVHARRDLLKFVGGSAAALAFTPVPWKLLDDVSIWTQNWSWIPRPVRGEITYRHAACTLCPMGCPVRVRCSGAQPVAVLPASADRGLCACGLASHQVKFHPGRIRTGDADRALGALKQAMQDGRSIAIVDGWPGRVASTVYSRFAAGVKSGVHLAASPLGNTGPDLEHVRTLVSFGVPVLEDWGPPNLLLRRRDQVRIIYVGARFSITAEMADRWVPEMNDALLEEVRRNGPSVAVGPGDEPARINRLLGADAALVRRRDSAPKAKSISEVPDGSIQLLVAETPSIPFEVMKPKLAPDAVLIVFAAWPDEYTAAAQHVLPAAAPFETVEDVPAAFHDPAASFRLSPALMPAPALLPADFLARAMPSLGSLEENRTARITQIYREKRGTVDGKPLRELSLDAFVSALKSGSAWVDDMEAATAGAVPLTPDSRRLLTPRPLLARRIA